MQVDHSAPNIHHGGNTLTSAHSGQAPNIQIDILGRHHQALPHPALAALQFGLHQAKLRDHLWVGQMIILNHPFLQVSHLWGNEAESLAAINMDAS